MKVARRERPQGRTGQARVLTAEQVKRVLRLIKTPLKARFKVQSSVWHVPVSGLKGEGAGCT